MAVLILMMMAATVIEKLHGTEAAFSAIYHNPVFIALWAIAAVSGVGYLITMGSQKKFFTFLLHISFVVILIGAFVTHVTGKEGEMTILPGESGNTFVSEDGKTYELPFSVRLDNFAVERYRGSMAPSDYRSDVTVLQEGREPVSAVISMNHILKAGGYRFYQADFDMESGSSTLAVSRDPWGIGLTYAGYLLLLVSMIGFFFQKDSGFKAALRRVVSSSAAALALLMVLSPAASAKEASTQELPKALPDSVADSFGDLYIYYNDRICPLETMARDYTLKAYGKSHWKQLSAVQVVTGWLYYYDWWQAVPFKVKAKDRGTAKEAEKDILRASVSSGDALRIFPLADSTGVVRWYSCNDELPAQVLDNYDLWVFIRKSLDVIHEDIRKEDWDSVLATVDGIRRYQEKVAADVLPAPAKIKAEHLYNKISRPMVPFMASITIGIILFILSGFWLSRGKRTPKSLQTVLAVLSGILLLYLTVVLALRWYVSGHAPFAGSYSVMMLIAWLASLAMLLLYRKFPLIQPLGFILAGFTMLMASMASANPQITHLMPVLQSPLLSVHVLSMMISYTLFGLVALNGIMGVVLPSAPAREMLRDVSLTVLCPAVFMLTFGTFLGAVWANISWGSYWGWDPKETWALVTILVYAAALHGSSLKAFRNPRFFHWYTIIAFMSVLITYFGVNLILGGMHSYT